jgi:hypothetical protein
MQIRTIAQRATEVAHAVAVCVRSWHDIKLLVHVDCSPGADGPDGSAARHGACLFARPVVPLGLLQFLSICRRKLWPVYSKAQLVEFAG